MSCFFCSSNAHVSHNCNIHKTDDARREFLASKKCCKSCLTPHDFQRNSLYRGLSCQECKTYRKCYICFSKAHHTVFCPDRLTTSETCLPKIDNDLLPRYIGMLSTKEKYSLFLSSSIDPDFFKLTPFKVKYEKEITILRKTKLTEYDFLFAEKLYLRWRVPHQLLSMNIVFRTEYLDVQSSRISTDAFLPILSLSKAKALTCRNTYFNPKITITDIFKNAPNLEDVQLHESNVEISNSWPDDLLQFNRAQLKLSLSLPYLNFNVESLAALMKKTSATIQICIPTATPNGRFNLKKAFQKVTNKLSSHFTPNVSKYFPPSTGLFVHIHDEFGCVVSKQYLLKNV